jgi:serine protease AprX
MARKKKTTEAVKKRTPKKRPTRVADGAYRARSRMRTTSLHSATVEHAEFAVRFKVRFPSLEAMHAATAIEAEHCDAQLQSEKRCFTSVQLIGEATEAQFHADLDRFATEFGATIVEDYRYELEADIFEAENITADDTANPSLDDVLNMIRAPQAWETSRGENITIAVVDTGVEGSRPEFPQTKRAGSWQPQGHQPWTDWQGHGTMCACIAAGTRASGGVFDGVAPDAQIIACKTYFYDSELAAIYDFLTDRARGGETIVATNSFGRKTGTPPPRPQDSDFIAALDEAIGAGIHVFFSAGNNHARAGGDPDACHPNSVWLHKSRADVMAVATCRLDESMWYYSSRGPGQFFGEPGTNEKPDVTAPTPRNGRVVYGNGIRTLANGWGTSGACPQAAGLAALLLSVRPHMTREQLFGKIAYSARDVGHLAHCQGAGVIDCEAALQMAFSP